MLDKILNSNSSLNNYQVPKVEVIPTVNKVTPEQHDPLPQEEQPQDQHSQEQSKEKTQKIIESLNSFLKDSSTHLKFEFHEKLQKYYVAIVDDETNEVVKEIPPKKLLDMYAAMTDYLGLLVDKKV